MMKITGTVIAYMCGPLEDLIEGHREIFNEMPDLLERFYECYGLVQALSGTPRPQ
jgi:hypothetical protein